MPDPASTDQTTPEANQDPRETINEVLKNLHGSLKWYWQLVMGFAMARGIDTVYAATFKDPDERLWSPAALFAVAFVPTFVRFFFGDARYLDMHYIEHRKWVPEKDYLDVVAKKISRFRFWTDVIFLLLHGIAFILLGKLLSSTRLFFCVYVVLLFCNVVYLSITRHHDEIRDRRWRLHPRDSDGPWWWIRNNLAHCVLMTSVIAWSYAAPVSLPNQTGPTLQYAILLALCLTNSVLDLSNTHQWYLPKLSDDMDKELRAPRPLDRATSPAN